jgi:sugar lactone lactonase YvrE
MRFSRAFFLALFFWGVTTTAQNIRTAAGGALPNGVAATTASVAVPYGLAMNTAGNLFVACSAQNAICEVSSGGTLTIVAGTGGGGYAGDGSPATSAQLDFPSAAAFDQAGNLFIADTSNNAIRRVAAGTGVITTVAGTGVAGYSGDGGAATSAQLNSPVGVTVDTAGNIFIADTVNNVIRRVDAGTNNITTVAGTGVAGYSGDGGVATSAQLFGPSGVAFDQAGDLFIADSSNSVVRRVDAQTGTITTFAGNNVAGYSGDGGSALAAQLDFPSSVVLDASGNLYIADYSNNVVRRVNAQTGVITTIAGNGITGYGGDGGSATSAELNSPAGVLLDQAGDLYIADTWNNRVRRVDAQTAVITTVAGNGFAGLTGDGALAVNAELSVPSSVVVDSSDNLVIADFADNCVREVNAQSGIITLIAGSGVAGYSGDGGSATIAQLNTPSGVFLDQQGNLYIADSANNVIRRVDAQTNFITTVAGTGDAGYAGDGGAATTAQLNYPTDVAVDAAGDIFIGDYQNQCIREVNGQTGTITTVAGNGIAGYSGDGGSATSAELNYPAGVALGLTGDIFIADYTNNRIRRVDARSGLITTVAGNGTGGYSGDGAAATSAELNMPSGVFIDQSGAIFIADSVNNLVRRVDANSGLIATVAGNGTAGFSGDGSLAISAELSFPMGVAVDATGQMWIADSTNNRIRQVDAPPAGQLAPTQLDFGDQDVDTTSASQSVTLTNTGGSPLAITSIEVTSQFGETDNCPILPETLAAGDNCSISVTFSPSSTGSASGSLSINDNAYTSPQSVSLQGTGTEESESEINLGVAPGSSSTSSVAAGQPASFTLLASAPTVLQSKVNRAASLTTTMVSFSCSGAPQGATCSLSPTSAPLTNTATTVVVTVATAGQSQAMPGNVRLPADPKQILPVLLALLLLSVIWTMKLASSRRLQLGVRNLALAAALASMCLVFVGCGYAGHPGQSDTNQNSVTPAGSYTITVTATSGGASRAINLTLVVK